MKKIRKQILNFLVSILITLTLTTQILAFFPGATFDERAQNYISDNGNYWVNKYSSMDPPYYQHQTIWAWLENDANPLGVHQTIGWFLENIGGGPHDDPSWPWQEYWAKHSHLTTVTGLRVILQYGDLIKQYDQQYGWNDYNGIKNRYSISDDGSFYSAFGNNNFAFTYTMPGYLWAEYFDPNYDNRNIPLWYKLELQWSHICCWTRLLLISIIQG